MYHADERDFLASATDLSDLRGQLPATFPELLEETPTDLPRDRDGDRYEEERLSGEVIAEVPFENGVAAVASLLTDRAETTREAARGRLAELFAELDSVDALVAAAGETTPSVPESAPDRESVAADLRVLSLLSADSGLRIAGPDFDPFYATSGGYGYTWFRDDAEISAFLLGADDRLGLGLDEWHARSAEMYVAAQRPDGSWPHRVWPRNGALAPGWANARIEDGPDVDYQADQTGSVIAYLSQARAAGVDVPDLDATLVAALAGLDETTFTVSEKQKMLLIEISRHVESLAFRHGSGRLHSGFQSISRIDDERGTRRVYEDLAAAGVDVHAYGADTALPSLPDGISTHTDPGEELRRACAFLDRSLDAEEITTAAASASAASNSSN